MITGKTESGFEFELPDDVIDDMELLDALVAMDKGDLSAVSPICERMLGTQRAALYEHLRRDGRVRISDVSKAVVEIFAAIKDGKKS